MRTCRPSTVIVAPALGTEPATAPRTAGTPEPTSPMTATSSRSPTCRSMGSAPSRSRRPRTSSTGEPAACAGPSSSSTAEPTMRWVSAVGVSSCFGNVPTVRPSRSAVARSAMRQTSPSRWVTRMMPVPRSRSREMTSSSRSVSRGSSAAVGSSRSRNRGRCSSARAISISFRSAASSPATFRRGSMSIPRSCSSSRAVENIRRRSTRRARVGACTETAQTFSPTVRSGNRW